MNKWQISAGAPAKLPYVEELTIRRTCPAPSSSRCRSGTRWPASCPPAGLQRQRHQRRRRQRTLMPEETGTAAGEAWLISVGGKLLEPRPGTAQRMTVTGLTALSPQAGTQLAVPQAEQTQLPGPAGPARSSGGAGGRWTEGVLHRPARRPRCCCATMGRFDVKLPLSGI